MPAWFNSDGLLIRLGPEEAQVGGGGEYKSNGPLVETEFDVNFNMLNAFGVRTLLDETVKIPNGGIIQLVEFKVIVPFASGGAATLSFGLASTDRVTAFAATGLVNATALATINTVGATVTGAGASINTVLANATPNLISATVGVANFTAGRGKLRVRYFIPTGAPKITGALA